MSVCKEVIPGENGCQQKELEALKVSWQKSQEKAYGCKKL